MGLRKAGAFGVFIVGEAFLRNICKLFNSFYLHHFGLNLCIKQGVLMRAKKIFSDAIYPLQ